LRPAARRFVQKIARGEQPCCRVVHLLEVKPTSPGDRTMHKQLILLFSLAAASAPILAKPCSMHAGDLSVNGAPLTYEKAKSLRGAMMIGSTVHIGPVPLPNGMRGRIAIEPDGCARIVSAVSSHG
jgi:hypothetical protein